MKYVVLIAVLIGHLYYLSKGYVILPILGIIAMLGIVGGRIWNKLH